MERRAADGRCCEEFARVAHEVIALEDSVLRTVVRTWRDVSRKSTLPSPAGQYYAVRSAVGSGMNFQGSAGHAFDFAMGHMFSGEIFYFLEGYSKLRLGRIE
jgi:hypothetical protein